MRNKYFYAGIVFALVSVVIAVWPLGRVKTDDEVTEKRKAELVGLSLDDYRSKSSDIIAKRAVSVILWKYLSLHNNRYRIDISKADAVRLGVPSELYDEVCNDIGTTNRILADHEDMETNIHVSDVFKVYKDYLCEIEDTRDNYAGAVGLRPDSVLMREMISGADGGGDMLRQLLWWVSAVLAVVSLLLAVRVARRKKIKSGAA